MVDLSNIRARKRETLLVDPYEIFRKNIARMSESGVNDLWAGQRDALREWHDKRQERDISLVLNTGAGKTLIGALISQSLVNETRSKVVYVCGSIQLVEQTREKFESYGLMPTTYINGHFDNNQYDRCQSVCLTTYQALFNGRSVFFKEDISAIIFDDAHTAEGMIKNHFSLDIRQHRNPELYHQLCAIFQPYFQQMGRAGTFSEICNGQNTKVELIHPSEIRKHYATICTVLDQHGVSNDRDTLFSWAHLKDHIDMCAVFISSGAIQIIPPFVPVSRLPYFGNEIRRVYLTATMLGKDAFIRTFGRLPSQVIQPDTPAGQCERLILFPGSVFSVADEFMAVQELVKNSKALIICPNKAITKKWDGSAEIPQAHEFLESMNDFKEANDNRKIVVTARYDGIDLPGDTCRVLIMDGLPMGSSLLDKFQWESLKLTKALRSIVACRVVQSMGRISRGMSDYGVVIVMDKDYIKWLNQPINQACLPEFIQKQLLLGSEISEKHVSNFGDLQDIMRQCLHRDPGWINAYQDFLEESEVEKQEQDDDALVRFAQAEVKFASLLWERNFAAAGREFESILTDAFSLSDSLGAWYAHWLAYCFELAGDLENAETLYRRATGVAKTLPKSLSQSIIGVEVVSDQAKEITGQFEIRGGASVAAPKNMGSLLTGLKTGTSTNSTEESLRALGQLMGLTSTRPDKEHGAGPDVLWYGEGVALCIEAKTAKGENSSYSKDDIGQMANHIQWVKDEYPDAERVIPVFVGPILPVSKSASPPEDLYLTTLESFEKLGSQLQAALADIAVEAMPLDLVSKVHDLLARNEQFLWPECIDKFDLEKLKKND